MTPNVKVPEACTNLYYLAFPLGFAVSFTVHYCLNGLFPPPGLGVIDEVDYYNTFTDDEALKLGVALLEPIEGQAASVREEMGKDGKTLAGERDITAV